MRKNKIGIIIRREYLNRVKKKSFLLITFLAPILFAAMCLLPALIMSNAKEESKKVAVVDASGIVMPKLVSGETATYTDCRGQVVDSIKHNLETLGYDAVLSISPLDSAGKTVSADIYSIKPLGLDLSENIDNHINSAVEDYRVSSYKINGLDKIMKDVKSDVKLHSFTLDEKGKETVSESGVFMIVSMVLGMIIYMFIALFGGMVMSSVIEEKSSRVIEVLISSVKATELMFGKIIGIALVALTQFLLWIVLTVAIVTVVGAITGPSLMSGMDSVELAAMGGVSAEQLSAVSEPSEMSVIISSLANMHLGQILVCFFIFFVLGYMLYASLFAAVG